MTIERRNPYGSCTEAMLVAFEKTLPGPLPAPYRAFILDFNGARFVNAKELTEVRGGSRLNTLFGLHTGPQTQRLSDANSQRGRLYPSELLLVGADPYGNYFGMPLAGNRCGEILFVDHEALRTPVRALTSVATSFAALVDRHGLDVADEPVPATIDEAVGRGDMHSLRSILASGECEARGFVHRAVSSGSLDVLRLVLDHGGDPNERGAIGGSETPLFVTAREGRVDMTALLLERGADPDLRCDQNGTALEMAQPWPELFALLAHAGATAPNFRIHVLVKKALEQRPIWKLRKPRWWPF